jgi:hypothetical protein
LASVDAEWTCEKYGYYSHEEHAGSFICQCQDSRNRKTSRICKARFLLVSYSSARNHHFRYCIISCGLISFPLCSCAVGGRRVEPQVLEKSPRCLQQRRPSRGPRCGRRSPRDRGIAGGSGSECCRGGGRCPCGVQTGCGEGAQAPRFESRRRLRDIPARAGHGLDASPRDTLIRATLPAASPQALCAHHSDRQTPLSLAPSLPFSQLLTLGLERGMYRGLCCASARRSRHRPPLRHTPLRHLESRIQGPPLSAGGTPAACAAAESALPSVHSARSPPPRSPSVPPPPHAARRRDLEGE